ncbi:MAG: helix-turn-helix domain-containing protein, partial [Chloroflexota bacterium]
MSKLSYKERARLRREQEILRTAARMIRDHGYVNLNMDDLAEEVGISKPTLYQHFKGKDDMVAKTMIQTMLEMEQYIKDLQTESAIDGLVQILRYMLKGQ